MTRQDLVDILKQDGTQQQIEEYVATKELTEAERDRIYDFLRAENQKEADKIFEEILRDVTSKPVYETGRDEKKGWAALRVDVAEQIKSLKDVEFQLEERLENYCLQQQEVESKFGKEMAAHFADIHKEEYQKDAEALSVKSKQHSALALMHTEAQSMEAQASARVFVEATQPYRDVLKHSWNELSNRVNAAVKHTQNFRAARAQTNDLDFHPVKDTINKIRLHNAKSHVKESNKIKAQIEKEEKKLIVQANKVQKKEFEREAFLNKLKSGKFESWLKGEHVNDAPEKIHDVEKAKEILKASEAISDKKFAIMQANLDKLKEQQQHEENRANQSLERIAADLRERREEVLKIGKDIAQQVQDGELGYNAKNFDILERNLQNGMDSTYINGSSLDQDLRTFMKDNGYEDIIEDRER